MKKYAVIVYYTFDPESEVYLFDTYEKACEYLKAMYDYCFKFAMEDEDFKEDESYCIFFLNSYKLFISIIVRRVLK